LATALEGAAVPPTAGAVVDALVSSGVPERQARTHEADLRAGRILVVVSAEARAEEAAAILRRCGAAGPGPPVIGARRLSPDHWKGRDTVPEASLSGGGRLRRRANPD
jgi:hypothetical protein